MACLYRKPKSRFWWVGYLDGGKPVQRSLKVTAKDATKILRSGGRPGKLQIHLKSIDKLKDVKKKMDEGAKALKEK